MERLIAFPIPVSVPAPARPASAALGRPAFSRANLTVVTASTVVSTAGDGAEIYCAPEGAQPRHARMGTKRFAVLPFSYRLRTERLLGNLARVGQFKRRTPHFGDTK
ncbi:MAG TPA: hypothetical protein VGG27_01300 [Magnetospirillaceae bacterium]|jgi:hypothetical protein